MPVDIRDQAGRTGFKHRRVDQNIVPNDGTGTSSDSTHRHHRLFIVQRGNSTEEWVIVRTEHRDNGTVKRYVVDDSSDHQSVNEGWERKAGEYLCDHVLGSGDGGALIHENNISDTALEAADMESDS